MFYSIRALKDILYTRSFAQIQKMPPPISQASFFLYRALGLLTFFLDTQLGGRCAALGGVTQQRCSFSTVDFLAYKNPGGGLETPNQSWSGGKEIGMSE